MNDKPTLADELEHRESRATSGPWCAEQCGDKCDDPVLGIGYDADDDNCERPLAGWLEDFDDAGQVKEYYTEQIAGEWTACDGNSASANLDLIMWLRNHVPVIIAALRTHPKDAEPSEAVVAAADAVVAAFEKFNDAEHNRQNCAECEGDGEWSECEPCSEKVGELLNGHLLAIQAYKDARALTAAPQHAAQPGDAAAQLEGDAFETLAADAYSQAPVVVWPPEKDVAIDPGDPLAWGDLAEFEKERVRKIVRATLRAAAPSALPTTEKDFMWLI